jgi:hypothetical protein
MSQSARIFAIAAGTASTMTVFAKSRRLAPPEAISGLNAISAEMAWAVNDSSSSQSRGE